jgi:hypothetical protein
MISRNQNDIDDTTKNREEYNNMYAKVKLCIDKAVLAVNESKDILVYIGQGEGETKWKGWS